MSATHVPLELRREVRARASGFCECCRISEKLTFVAHEIDHIIAEKHGGRTIFDNLALCCTLCNKRKGTDMVSIDPSSGEIVLLFNPRKDTWEQHFRFEGLGITPLTPTGRTTARLLGFNEETRIAERAVIRS